MSWVAVAIAGGAVVGAAATYYSSKQSSDAVKSASKSSRAAQLYMYNQSREDYAPWREAGETALERLDQELYGESQFDPAKEPGYRFGFEEFVKDPYLSGQSSVGKRLSGETLKGLSRYSQDYAESKYSNYLDRFFRLAGFGSSAASANAQNAMAVGGNLAQMNYQTALAQGNIQSQATAAYGGIAQNAIQNYLDYKMGVTPQTQTAGYNNTVSNQGMNDPYWSNQGIR